MFLCFFVSFICLYIYRYIASQTVTMDWILLPLCGELWEHFSINLIYLPCWISVVTPSNKEIYFLLSVGQFSGVLSFLSVSFVALATSSFLLDLLSYHNNSISCLCLWAQITSSLSYIYIYSCQATGNCLNLNLCSDEILLHLNVFPLIFLNPWICWVWFSSDRLELETVSECWGYGCSQLVIQCWFPPHLMTVFLFLVGSMFAMIYFGKADYLSFWFSLLFSQC